MDKEKIKQAVTLFLEGIGENTKREGLTETPERIAQMCEELFAGYESSVAEHLAGHFPQSRLVW